MVTTTAADITAALRELWPTPVRLSTRKATALHFLVKLPSAPASQMVTADGSYHWIEGFLGRRLGRAVTVKGTRVIRRHDCGRDIEVTLLLGRAS
jgi:hypothetical protein